MRNRLGVAVLCGGVVVTTLLLAMGSSSSGSAIGESSTTARSATPSATIGTQPGAAWSAAAEAIGNELGPYGYQLDGAESSGAAGRSFVNVSLKRIGDAAVSVSLYRRFDSRELQAAGLTSRSAASGTIWVGANDPEITAIYFLSSSGVGLHIASIDRTAVGPLTTEQLGTIAQHLASVPQVISAAVA